MRVTPLRLKPGDDLLLALESWMGRQNEQAGCVISGIGSLSVATLRLAGRQRSITLRSDLEILSLAGTLSADGAHLHIALADDAGAVIGGHLCSGSLVRTTAELVVGLLPEWQFRRQLDPATGYKELQITPPSAPADPDTAPEAARQGPSGRGEASGVGESLPGPQFLDQSSMTLDRLVHEECRTNGGIRILHEVIHRDPGGDTTQGGQLLVATGFLQRVIAYSAVQKFAVPGVEQFPMTTRALGHRLAATDEKGKVDGGKAAAGPGPVKNDGVWAGNRAAEQEVIGPQITMNQRPGSFVEGCIDGVSLLQHRSEQPGDL